MNLKMYLLSMVINEKLEQKYGKLIFYMTTAARILYAAKWKDKEAQNINVWLLKLYEFMETDKLTQLLKGKMMQSFKKEWELLTCYLKDEWGPYFIISLK